MTVKLSAVAKGDLLEDESYILIVDAIKAGKLSINFNDVKVFQKKGYYSEKRKSNIIFDLSIEVWPKGAKRYSLLYLVECKNYSTKRVPVSDVQNFDSSCQQVIGHKGIFISKSGYQTGALSLGENSGLMMIDVAADGTYDILLHKKDRNESSIEDSQVSNFLMETFSISTKIEGLKILSKKTIEEQSLEFLEEINGKLTKGDDKVSLDKIIQYLTNTQNLEIKYKHFNNGQLGLCNITNNTIYIEESTKNTESYPFIVAHEIAHFLLHKNLKVNNNNITSFTDTEYNIFTKKHEFTNDINWIEWQANYYGSCLLMPSKSLHIQLMTIQEKIGNRGKGFLYVDNQPCNHTDYQRVMVYLSDYFGVSKTSLRYRLESLKYLEFSNDYKYHLTPGFGNMI